MNIGKPNYIPVGSVDDYSDMETYLKAMGRVYEFPYIFSPQPDITAIEIADLIVLIGIRMAEKEFGELPRYLQRHFLKET